MAEIPTVKIQHEGGFAVINEADFDPKQHKRFSEPKAKQDKSAAGAEK